VRFLLIDDHPIYREAISTLLSRTFRGAKIDCFARLNAALEFLATTSVDLVMIDFSLPDIEGCDGVSRVLAAAGGAPVLVMSGVAGAREAAGCIAAGAVGFLPKTMEGPVFTDAVALVLHGGTYIPAEFVSPPAEGSAGNRGTADAVGDCQDLDEREIELLRFIAAGASNKEIALKTGLREVTVKFYLSRLFKRLGVKNRSQAAVVGVRLGLGS
jgi:DNA-binding NarL/FixJ family response regulator